MAKGILDLLDTVADFFVNGCLIAGVEMNLKHPHELIKFKESLKKFIKYELDPISDVVEKTEALTDEIFQKIKDKGLFGLTIPPKYGGKGLKHSDFCLILEEVAKAYAFVRLLVHQMNGICPKCILDYGTEEQKKRYLPPIAEGRHIAAFALTEPNTGTGADIKLMAVKERDKFILNGKKHLITYPHADITITFAKTHELNEEKGITAFIVEKGIPGFHVVDMPETIGCRGPRHGELIFKDCLVPQKNVLGKVGNGLTVALDALDISRIQIAVAALGLAEKLLELSIDFAKKRITFGKPISERQATQWKIAEMATNIYASRTMTYDALAKYDQGKKISREAAMAKLFASQMVCKVADEALQIHGGIGYTAAYPVERIYRDVRSMRLEEGTDDIQKLVISRSFLRNGK
jgi:acyl-CoA dehydrogenase